MKNSLPTVVLLFLAAIAPLSAQDTIIPLWPAQDTRSTVKEIREEKDIVRISNVSSPEVAVYLPSKANRNGQGVVIFPGGGYQILAYDWEGTDIAKWLNSQGIAAFVVKYRLPGLPGLSTPNLVPLMDAQRAIRVVRSMGEKWQLNEGGLGIMGFSAGGHLAATLGTKFDQEVYPGQDPADALSARPDFMILMYPVITFTTPAMHRGSMESLLGKGAGQELREEFSAELQVSGQTPPTLLIHAMDDAAVPPENSILFYNALRAHDVPSSMHIYSRGGHGFSLALKDPYLHAWTAQAVAWLKSLPDQ